MTLNNNRALDDKYEIVREIKKGGFGIVYFGVDKKLNKPVAIKEIAPNLLDDPKYIDMFQEEARNIAKLNHNNIVHIYELKKTSDRHLYIIMEYIEGIDLEKVIRSLKKISKPLPPHLAVYIISEMCMALDYAHQRRDAFTNKPLNLVHQDISPSNIMISKFGNVKLIDFGIATVRRHRKEKRDNKLRGKIPYMAPEQLIMGNHPDNRSDIFSLGLVLNEIITGTRLFASHEEIIAAGKSPKWFRKSLKGKKIPPALAKILFKALEVDLSKRYQSANHMYIDLLQYLISCNETGELMDDLSRFLAKYVPTSSLDTPITAPTGYNTPAQTSREVSNASYFNSSPGNSSDPFQASRTAPNFSSISQVTQPQSLPNQPKLNNTNHSRHAIPKHQPNYQTIEFDLEEGEEELKTVIDVLRVSARNNKKHLFQIGFSILFMICLFGVFDTVNGWTRAGVWIYDFIFPPAIEIVTLPANAQIYLDENPVEGKTPLSIAEINPGVHKLVLSLPGYKPITRSLFVPRDGAIKIQGKSQIQDNRKYLFRFSTEISIDSTPPNAQVYINGMRYNQITPCKISWEVGNPISIALEKPGFEKLSGFKLNTIDGYDETEDRRFWDLQVINDNSTTYNVTGIFRKRVVIETIPPGVEIVDANTKQVLGITGEASGVFLIAGKHKLELRKDKFINRQMEITIDESFDGKIREVLLRKVSFTAYDSNSANRNEIGANVISIKSSNKEYLRRARKTPFDINLPALLYSVVFTKPGFKRTTLRLGTEASTTSAPMQKEMATLGIIALDALTELPLPGVEIYYNFSDRPQTLNTFLDQTNSVGTAQSTIDAGNYILLLKKPGYADLTKSVQALAGKPTNLTFNLFPTN